MTIPMRCQACAILVLLLLGPALIPSASAQHAAHVHGVSRLNLAIEGNSLLLELHAPGADIVGFEHAPRSVGDRQKIDRAVARLKEGEALFDLPAAAGCTLAEAKVEAPEQGHGDHRHGEGHSEFTARYRFACTAIAALTSIDVRLFQAFKGIHEIEAQFATRRGQGKAELTHEATRLTLAP